MSTVYDNMDSFSTFCCLLFHMNIHEQKFKNDFTFVQTGAMISLQTDSP